jgi:hypothetical protein
MVIPVLARLDHAHTAVYTLALMAARYMYVKEQSFTHTTKIWQWLSSSAATISGLIACVCAHHGWRPLGVGALGVLKTPLALAKEVSQPDVVVTRAVLTSAPPDLATWDVWGLFSSRERPRAALLCASVHTTLRSTSVDPPFAASPQLVS